MYINSDNSKFTSSRTILKSNVQGNKVLSKTPQLLSSDSFKVTNPLSLANKDYITLSKREKNISFGFEPITTSALIAAAIAAVKNVVANNWNYAVPIVVKSIKDEMEVLKSKRLEKLAISKIKELAEREASGKLRSTNLLQELLDKGTIDSKLNLGLNKVMGREVEKFQLITDTISPIVATMHGDKIYQETSTLNNGVLFFGPTGGGKTYFSRALGEHLKAKGGNFVEISRGNPNTRMNETRKAFREAEDLYTKTGKFTAIFVDELESLAPEIRIRPDRMDEVNELKILTDKCSTRGILWIGATNNFELIDSALKRRGRIDKYIPLGPITKTDIAKVLNYHLGNSGTNIDYVKIADEATNKKSLYTPNDIADIAGDLRLKNNRNGNVITTDDVLVSMEKIRPSLDNKTVEIFKKDVEFAKDSGYLNENYEII